MTAEGCIDLLEKAVGAVRRARCERLAHDRARGALGARARIEVDRADTASRLLSFIQGNQNPGRAAQERGGGVGRAGEVVGENQDPGQ